MPSKHTAVPHHQHHHHNNKTSPGLVPGNGTSHHVHGTNNSQAQSDPSHCCSCNNCNNDQNNKHGDYYNMCECTSCRNLGNSIDICCQCCSCSSEYPRYTVASMAMQEDTLEVCLQQQTATDSSSAIPPNG